jgi:hypothetical protein
MTERLLINPVIDITSLSMRRDPTWLLLPILALPLVIFSLTFVNPFVGLPACIVLLAGLGLGVRQFAEIGSGDLNLKTLSICFGIALAGCLLGGQGRLFYATDDWIIRNAVLLDMVSTAWPPAYDWNGGRRYCVPRSASTSLRHLLGRRSVSAPRTLLS